MRKGFNNFSRRWYPLHFLVALDEVVKAYAPTTGAILVQGVFRPRESDTPHNDRNWNKKRSKLRAGPGIQSGIIIGTYQNPKRNLESRVIQVGIENMTMIRIENGRSGSHYRFPHAIYDFSKPLLRQTARIPTFSISAGFSFNFDHDYGPVLDANSYSTAESGSRRALNSNTTLNSDVRSPLKCFLTKQLVCLDPPAVAPRLASIAASGVRPDLIFRGSKIESFPERPAQRRRILPRSAVLFSLLLFFLMRWSPAVANLAATGKWAGSVGDT
ncbi:hypothetical protein EVAR_14305_1 [Eumeta japonica]|uniref:Uncharacterized protein n=1 Tax=Eumeta variegata TaxID=151549 RepID=A0A4C1UNR9_EUMVA|nr:hypothetical protein EVAR_14305_1 [Eumeta japonica]